MNVEVSKCRCLTVNRIIIFQRLTTFLTSKRFSLALVKVLDQKKKYCQIQEHGDVIPGAE